MRPGLATVAVAAFALLGSAPARADITDYVGKPVASVSLQSEGRAVTDPRLRGLVETRPGDPLSMARVRESITHLFSVGRFEDVRVNAVAEGGAVTLTYELVPLYPIAGYAFEGDTANIDRGHLRQLVTERFGPSPTATRLREMAALLADELRQSGYLGARVTARSDASIERRRATIVFTLAPGERARIGTIDIDGDAGMTRDELLRDLELDPGAPFQRAALEARIDRYLARRRQDGYYTARLTLTTALSDGDRTVNLKLAIQPGPHVVVQFAGDPLPADRRDELVPVVREASADEDLLEDSSLRIQDFLRGQGYRDAAATHAREERNGELIITFTVRRGPQYRVGRMDFSGNTSVPLTDLQPRLRVRPGQPFSMAAIDADLATVEDIYRRRGFASVDAVATFESQPDVGGAIVIPVAIRVAVTENVRTIVRRVRVEGTRALAAADVAAGLGLQPGGPFFVSQMAMDRDAIQLRYANLGFQSATVTTNPGLYPDGTQADVLFTVTEGPQVFVDHLIIVGNERIRTETIERELQFKPGEPLGLEVVAESQRRLAALGLFRRARITELGHGDESRRDVLVTVEEAPVATVGYGGGLEAGEFLRTDEDTGVASERLEFAPRAFFEIGRRNLFGKNRSINLFTRVSLRNQIQEAGRNVGEYRVIGTFREPRVFNSTADAFLTATIEQQGRTSFTFARRAFNAEAGRRLSRAVSATGSYQIQRTELFDEQIDPEFRIPIDRLFPQVRLSSFSTSIVRDTRDDLTDPTAGRFFSANGQIAGRRIGSEVGFAKSFFSAQMFRIVPRTRQIVLAASARVGLATAFARETVDRDENGNPILGPDGQPLTVVVRDLPASERFFAGGDTTVRGFALDQLGTPDTIDKDGFPTGGGGLMILNAELRVPVRGGLGVVGFVDAGNVFARTADMRPGDLRGALGFGVRYKSPIGPIRVDVGFKLDRQTIAGDKRESLTALHISLGQAF